ncbi:hypothetical protein TthAA37_25250 (plasmid) [Thermus thermophilus]|nr:hypothetical protein TthAA37_25250 [Thermus thermophilus]
MRVPDLGHVRGVARRQGRLQVLQEPGVGVGLVALLHLDPGVSPLKLPDELPDRGEAEGLGVDVPVLEGDPLGEGRGQDQDQG